MSGKDECPECGNEYQRLGSHWHKGNCPRPKFNQNQMNLLTGLMLGDGWLRGRNAENSFLVANSTNKPFLDWLKNKLGVLTTNVSLQNTSEEQYQNALQNQKDGVKGFETVNKENYNDLYVLRTRSHPQLNSFRKWYKDGRITFPENIELNPTSAKIWYVSDGWLAVKPYDRYRVMIKATNQSDRPDFLKSLFEGVGFENVGFSRHSIQLGVESSKEFFRWIGTEPIPSFEYKWPQNRAFENPNELSGRKNRLSP